MQRKQGFFLVALMVGFGLVTTSTSVQAASSGDDMRFGIGASITRVNDGGEGDSIFMPKAILDFSQAMAEFGFYLRTGEKETQFMLQLGGAFYPLELDYGDLGFGLQFNLTTDNNHLNINNKVEYYSAFMVGVFAEYKIHASDGLDIGLRIFPFQLLHGTQGDPNVNNGTKGYNRTGIFAPGISAGFFF